MNMISKQLMRMIDNLRELINKHNSEELKMINNYEFKCDVETFELIYTIIYGLYFTKYKPIAKEILLLLDEFLIKEITPYRIVFFFDQLYRYKMDEIIDNICIEY